MVSQKHSKSASGCAEAPCYGP